MSEINVEQIMEEIRTSIPDNAPWETVSFADAAAESAAGWEGEQTGSEDLERSFAAARESARVEFFRPIPGGRIKTFCKRVVRKLIRFCVEPITQAVSEFNRNAVRALGALRRALREQRSAQSRCEQELRALAGQVEALTARVEELEKDRR